MMTKTITTGLFIVFLTTIVSGQNKKELEIKVKELNTSLTATQTENENLTAKLDSTLKLVELYKGMYDIIQEKVIPYDFEPENIGVIIDSLKSSKDTSFENLMTGSDALRDTISIMTNSVNNLDLTIDSLQKKIISLQEQNSKLKAPLEIISDVQITELKKLKELLDSGILNSDEFDERKKIILKQE